MSDKEDLHENNVRVLNEEYERVLTNPDNIIVSDDLQELLDLPVPGGKDVPSIDTMVLSVLDGDNLPTSVRGEFTCLSKIGNEFTMTANCARVKKDFLKALDSLMTKPGMLTTQGEYTLEIQDCELVSWSVIQTDGTDFSLSIQFRSKDGIF